MAKPRKWLKHAAMAQIRWHKTTVRYVRLVPFSFLILIGRFAILEP
jgi:hypothetical protein